MSGMSDSEKHGRVRFYLDGKAEWRWQLIHRNGNIVADSGEGYQNRLDCEQGARAALTILSEDVFVAGAAQ